MSAPIWTLFTVDGSISNTLDLKFFYWQNYWWHWFVKRIYYWYNWLDIILNPSVVLTNTTDSFSVWLVFFFDAWKIVGDICFKKWNRTRSRRDMLYLKRIFDAFFTTDKMFRQFARMRNLHQILTFYVMCLYVLLNDDNDNGKSIDTNEIH